MLPFENWNCVTGLLTELSSLVVWSAPPSRCPSLCQSHQSCLACLSADGGGTGGKAACYWSEAYEMVSDNPLSHLQPELIDITILCLIVVSPTVRTAPAL